MSVSSGIPHLLWRLRHRPTNRAGPDTKIHVLNATIQISVSHFMHIKQPSASVFPYLTANCTVLLHTNLPLPSNARSPRHSPRLPVRAERRQPPPAAQCFAAPLLHASQCGRTERRWLSHVIQGRHWPVRDIHVFMQACKQGGCEKNLNSTCCTYCLCATLNSILHHVGLAKCWLVSWANCGHLFHFWNFWFLVMLSNKGRGDQGTFCHGAHFVLWVFLENNPV